MSITYITIKVNFVGHESSARKRSFLGFNQTIIPTKPLLRNLAPQPFGGNTFRALQRQAKGTVPIQLTQTSDSAAYTKQHSVKLELREAVVPQKNTGVAVNVGVRILNLSVLLQNIWHNLVDSFDDLEELIVW
jgi:hypothetical protein